MLKIFIFSLLLLGTPSHLSFMGVEYSSKTDMFKVLIKLKYEDFILDYRFIINDDQNFDPSGKIDTTIIFVNKYINNRVQIFADDKQLEGRLTDIKWADGEILLNLLYDNNKKAGNYRVKNHILKELYKDQANLLIFKYKDFEEGAKLTSGNWEQTFKVN